VPTVLEMGIVLATGLLALAIAARDFGRVE
jgi:hypothetical protein